MAAFRFWCGNKHTWTGESKPPNNCVVCGGKLLSAVKIQGTNVAPGPEEPEPIITAPPETEDGYDTGARPAGTTGPTSDDDYEILQDGDSGQAD